MCIAFPGKIISVKDNAAVIEIGGMRREIYLDLLDEEIKLDDYVICHAGYAIRKLDEIEAQENLSLLKELIENEIY